MLAILLVVEIILLIVAVRFGKNYLFGLAAINMLSIAAFPLKIINLGFLNSNIGTVWYSVVFAVQLIVLIQFGIVSSKELVNKLVFILIGFFLIVQTSASVPAYLGLGGDVLSAVSNRSLRVAAASLLAFVIGQAVLVLVYVKLHKLYFFPRYIVATVFGQLVDSLLFFPLAFSDWVLYTQILWHGFALKVIFGTCFAPIVYYEARKSTNFDNG